MRHVAQRRFYPPPPEHYQNEPREREVFLPDSRMLLNVHRHIHSQGKHHKHTLGNFEKYHHFLGARKALSPLEAAPACAGVWAHAYESTWVFCSRFLE